LGNPLINELFIGLKDKDLWSASHPRDDAQFDDYLKFPTLPHIINTLFGVTEPTTNVATGISRFDLLFTLHKGLPNLNAIAAPVRPVTHDDDDDESSSSSRKRHSSSSSSSSSSHSDDDDHDDDDDDAPPYSGSADLLRLNTAVPITAPTNQDMMAVLQGQLDGFPNGRRLVDDVVDIYLRVGMGQLCTGSFINFTHAIGATVLEGVLRANCPQLYGGPTEPASFSFFYTDRSPVTRDAFDLNSFPYLRRPIPGNLIGECWRQDPLGCIGGDDQCTDRKKREVKNTGSGYILVPEQFTADDAQHCASLASIPSDLVALRLKSCNDQSSPSK